MFKKIPTGIPSLDPIIKGGFPSGSLVVLMGEVGAGHKEFAYTSASMLSLMHSRGVKLEDEFIIPSKICYISLTRSKEDVLNELEASLPKEHVEATKNKLDFFDLSEVYFQKSFVPPSWTSSGDSEFGDCLIKKEQNLLKMLVKYLDENAESSVVIIDSLNEIIRSFTEYENWQDFISLLRGLQKASKKWNGVIYALLSSNIFETSKEEEIADCADGILVFKWETISSKRVRNMYVKKFRALLPHLEENKITRFDTKVTAKNGFEISRVRQIMGK